jgi:hypothetical protein
MALPLPECETPLDVCCDKAFLIADRILDIAHTAVTACIPEGDCGGPPIVGYVTVGTRIQDPRSDYLVVSLAGIAPSRRSADTTGRMQLPIYRASFLVQLLESGWPTPWGDEEQIFTPNPDEFMQAAKHSYSHAEAMYRALHVALTNNDLIPGCRDGSCYAAIGDLIPLEPSGGSVGWETGIVVGFDLGN